MDTLKQMIDIAIKDSQPDSDELEEASGYVLPRVKSDLDDKTPANIKKRITLLKSAAKHLEAAMGDLAKVPKLDFMGDLVHYSEEIQGLLSADGGQVGLLSLAKIYEKEAKGK